MIMKTPLIRHLSFHFWPESGKNRPLTAVTRVRIPLGSQLPGSRENKGNRAFLFKRPGRLVFGFGQQHGSIRFTSHLIEGTEIGL